MVKSFRFSPAPSLENCDRPLLKAALRDRRSVVFCTPGRENHELDRRALTDRQLRDTARIDDLAEAGRRRVDGRGGGGHRDLIGELTRLEGGVDVEDFSDVQVDVLADVLAEAGQRDGDAIGPGVEERHAVVAFLVRSRRRRHAGVDVRDFDCRPGDNAAGGIRHAALKGAARLLAEDQRRKREHDAGSDDRDDSRTHSGALLGTRTS